MRIAVATILLAALAVLPACGGGAAARQAELISQSDFHYQLAIGHYNANEGPIAIRELLTSLELYEDNVDALYLLGFIYQGRRDYVEAERLYSRALELEPDRYDIRNAYGTIMLQEERWEEAEDLFRELTRVPTYITPGHAHNNLGWALYNQSRFEDAADQFEMAIMFQPELCQAYNNQALAEEALGLTRAAMESYEDAIERCNSYAEPRYRLGAIYWRMGDLETGIELFEECYDISPDSEYGERCWEYIAEVESGW